MYHFVHVYTHVENCKEQTILWSTDWNTVYTVWPLTYARVDDRGIPAVTRSCTEMTGEQARMIANLFAATSVGIVRGDLDRSVFLGWRPESTRSRRVSVTRLSVSPDPRHRVIQYNTRNRGVSDDLTCTHVTVGL